MTPCNWLVGEKFPMSHSIVALWPLLSCCGYSAENPYLSVTSPSEEDIIILSESEDTFPISTMSAYTLDGRLSIMPGQSDFRVTITAEDGTEYPGQILTSGEAFPDLLIRYCQFSRIHTMITTEFEWEIWHVKTDIKFLLLQTVRASYIECSCMLNQHKFDTSQYTVEPQYNGTHYSKHLS